MRKSKELIPYLRKMITDVHDSGMPFAIIYKQLQNLRLSVQTVIGILHIFYRFFNVMCFYENRFRCLFYTRSARVNYRGTFTNTAMTVDRLLHL